jgi:hypothetical protein
VRMFTGGNGAPASSAMQKIAAEPTLQLIKLAKQATSDLFQSQRDEVQRSWGTALDQEEALAYLLADALDRELLPDEARKVGNKAVLLLKSAKHKDDLLRGNASAKRSKARKAAEKDAARDAALEGRMAGIDSEFEAARVALWMQPVDIALPPKASKLVTKQLPKPPDLVAALEAAAKAMATTAYAAEAAAAVVQSELERAEAKLKRLSGDWQGNLTTHGIRWTRYLGGHDEINNGIWDYGCMPPAVQAQRDAEFEAWAAALKEMRAQELAAIKAHGAASLAQDAAQEARYDALEAAASRSKQDMAQELEALRARHAAMAAERAAELEQDVAALAVLSARRASCDARRRAFHREGPATHLSLLRDAETVWGGNEIGSPKVFSLVGMSAESVHALAGEVSQTVTSVAERIDLDGRNNAYSQYDDMLEGMGMPIR